LRHDLRIEPIRGNVDTRIRKLDQGEFDAIILASAGLHRLGYADRITERLSLDLVLSAVGQGALAIETRAADDAINALVRKIDHERTRLACTAERAFLKGLGGGCLVPIAAHAVIGGGAMRLSGLVASPDGSEIVRGQVEGDATGAELLGEEMAAQLLARGAAQILSRD
jgi:hydroxymethylbilane synthase